MSSLHPNGEVRVKQVFCTSTLVSTDFNQKVKNLRNEVECLGLTFNLKNHIYTKRCQNPDSVNQLKTVINENSIEKIFYKASYER